MTGDGKGETKAADLVVNEIKTKFNGIAVANYGLFLELKLDCFHFEII